MKPTVREIQKTLKYFSYDFETKTDKDGTYITVKGKVIGAIALSDILEIDNVCIDCLNGELVLTIWNN